MESSPENPTDTGAPSTDEEVREAAKKLVALIEATLLRRTSHQEGNRGGSRMEVLPEKTTTEESKENSSKDEELREVCEAAKKFATLIDATLLRRFSQQEGNRGGSRMEVPPEQMRKEDLQENPATDEALGAVCEEAKKFVALIEATLLKRQEGNGGGSRMEVLQEQTTTEELQENQEMEALEENPSENPRIRECVETGVRLCSLLARTMFLKGTPISASAYYVASVKMNTTLPAIIHDAMLEDFPKLHQLIHIMMESNQRSKNNPRLERLLEVEMGVEGVLLGIQDDLKSLVRTESVLRYGKFTNKATETLEKKMKELPKRELQVEILDAIRVPWRDQGDSDFFALWAEDNMVLYDEFEKKWMEGLESYKKNVEDTVQGEKSEKSQKSKKTQPMNLYNWVKETPKTHPCWKGLRKFLEKALLWGCKASVLLRHFLISLQKSKTCEMVIEQLKDVVEKLAEDETNLAAKRIMKLGIFDLASEKMAEAGVAGFQADVQEISHQFKMLLIRVNLIFRHPISFRGRYDAFDNFRNLEDSLYRYEKQCEKHVDALKLKMNMSWENWIGELRAAEESWNISTFDIPSCD